MNTSIARTLVTQSIGNTPLSGFTLDMEDGEWVVSDGATTETFEVGAEADALRTYADFIDTFIGDDPDRDYADWIAARDEARADAEAL